MRSAWCGQDLERLKDKIDRINTPAARQLSLDMEKIFSAPADCYSRAADSLRVALTVLTAGAGG